MKIKILNCFMVVFILAIIIVPINVLATSVSPVDFLSKAKFTTEQVEYIRSTDNVVFKWDDGRYLIVCNLNNVRYESGQLKYGFESQYDIGTDGTVRYSTSGSINNYLNSSDFDNIIWSDYLLPSQVIYTPLTSDPFQIPLFLSVGEIVEQNNPQATIISLIPLVISLVIGFLALWKGLNLLLRLLHKA